MKTFRQLKESIIDIPRSTYAPGVFDDLRSRFDDLRLFKENGTISVY